MLSCKFHMENSSVHIELGSSQPVVEWPTLGHFPAKLQSHSLHHNRQNSPILILTLLFPSTTDGFSQHETKIRFHRSPCAMDWCGGYVFYTNTVIMGHLAPADEKCLPHAGSEIASPSFSPCLWCPNSSRPNLFSEVQLIRSWPLFSVASLSIIPPPKSSLLRHYMTGKNEAGMWVTYIVLGGFFPK